ncbi:SDR family NAD(P)-dependent oxidoreductase [Oceanicaulis sp. LC35]|uniref:SDR family NAD(P)-dependent oxidoreductase n=1 Tax=Oceanicaulis sp. LC35 TaxID=3349635 RepID=UPI003F8614CB
MQVTHASDRPLEGRSVIVTGAGKGLGAAFARALGRAGACVVVNNRIRDGAPDEASAVAQSIRDAGGQAVAEHSDVTAPDTPQNLVAAALDHFGRLDSVVCNAGASGPVGRFGDGSTEVIRAIMETNFFSICALMEACKPHLEASGSGRVLMIASSAGLYGLKGRPAYAASKGALNALAFSLADEWRGRVGVNVLCPYASTRMTGQDPQTDPSDDPMASEHIAAPAVWLTAPQCDRTGEVWLGGGGWLRRVRIQETEGAPFPEEIPDFEAFADTQSGLETLRGFTGAEAAFTDFFKTLVKAKPERSS